MQQWGLLTPAPPHFAGEETVEEGVKGSFESCARSLCCRLIYLRGGCEEMGEAEGVLMLVVACGCDGMLDWTWLGWVGLGWVA